MGPRITPQQQSEAAEALRAFSGVGLEMADFSLDDLQTRLANGFDQARLDRMDQNDVRLLGEVGSRITALNTDLASIEAYTLANFKDDFLYIAEYLPEPMKTEIMTVISATDQTGLDGLKEKWRANIAATTAAAAATAAQGTQLQNNNETPGLGLRRMGMLAAPDLNIADTVQAIKAEIAAEGLTDNAEIMRRFRAKLVPDIIDKLEAWARSNDDFVKALPANALNPNTTGKSEAELLEELTGETTIGESVIGDAGGLAATGLENLSGIGLAMKYSFIEEDPLLGALFEDADGKQPLMASLFSGDFDATSFTSHIETQLVGLFPDSLEFSKITEQFGTWADRPNDELTPEELKDIRTKLETIPRFFIGGEWEDKYHEYVRHEVAGKGAMDFDDWLLTQVDGLQKMLFTIMLQFTPLMNWWLNDSEDDDITRYGEHWETYKQLEGLERTPEGDVVTGGNTTETALITANESYGRLLQGFRTTMGPTEPLNIRINGMPLTAETIPVDIDFDSLLTLAATPSSAPLLTKGVELDDLLFVASHRGNQSAGDGMNFYFENGGVQMSYDFQELGYYTNLIDEVGGAALGAGAASFLAGAGLAFGPPGWFALAVGISAGAIIGHLSDLDNGDTLTYLADGKNFSFNDFSVTDFHAAIEEMKHDVSLIEESFAGITPDTIGPYIDDFEANQERFDFANIQSFPPEMFSEDGISPAFKDLLALPSEFWGDYKMDQNDITTFASELDTGFFSLGSINDSEGGIEKDNDWIWNDEGYEINGSGWLWDKEVHTAEEFFTWLRS